jgi:RNA polymerase I-specific transcription initiation factor RRN6
MTNTNTSTLADHPSLTPALHLRVKIGPATAIGSLSRGNPLTVVALASGSLVSEPGFEVRVNAQMLGQGVDYFHNDPDGRRMRLRSDLVVRYVHVFLFVGS